MKQEKLTSLINKITDLFIKYNLNYDQSIYVTKKARLKANIRRSNNRKYKIERLSKTEQEKLIKQSYQEKGYIGLLIKTLFLTGARVSEFVEMRVEDFFFEEEIIIIKKAKGNKQRVVPISRLHAQEINTYLQERNNLYLFETKRKDKYSPRRVQQIVKSIANKAGIKKKVHPHLLRHTVATFLLENGMPLDQIQVFLGHEKIETTRIYAKNSVEQIREEFRKAINKI